MRLYPLGYYLIIVLVRDQLSYSKVSNVNGINEIDTQILF